MALSPSVLITFGALLLAMIAVWAGRVAAAPHLTRIWTWPFAFAFAAALAASIMDVRGVLVLFAYAVACRAANRAAGLRLSLVSHLLLLLICAGLMLHLLPGFDNPRVLAGVLLSPDALPYTKYLNFDKAVAGLFLLGVYAPELVASDEGAHGGRAFFWRFALMTAAVIALSFALGYVRWEPKAPAWLPWWALSILFFTALPEEALFRGLVQANLTPRIGRVAALLLAAVLFGLAHAGGGASYVLLATVAGAGYGWIFMETRSIALAIVAHAGLDAIHFLLFTYPALA